VALTLGRLSYDRYTDTWPDAEPPDPDDLDAACDLLLRGARYDEPTSAPPCTCFSRSATGST
jgi:hypothetical protein